MILFIWASFFLIKNWVWLATSLTLLAVILLLKSKKNSTKLLIDNRADQKAEATILNFEKTGNRIRNESEIIFQIQVQPEKQRNFIAEKSAFISDEVLKNLVLGSKVRVVYKASNQRNITKIEFC